MNMLCQKTSVVGLASMAPKVAPGSLMGAPPKICATYSQT